jgi:hypothetical protein
MKFTPIDFYTNEKETFEASLKKTQRTLRILSFVRFAVFLTTVFCVYYFLGDARIMMLSAFLGAVLFVFLLKKYLKHKEIKEELLALVAINELEISVSNGVVSGLATGDEYKDASHQFSYDIDLFGQGSFFQFVNRTATKAGQLKLVHVLTENSISEIEQKQESVQELAEKPKWRQRFSAMASLVVSEISPNEIVKWIQSYALGFPTFSKFVPQLFALVSGGLILGIAFLDVSFSFLTVWFFLGLGFSGVYLKKVTNLYTSAGKVKSTFQQYYKLLEVLEQTDFSSKLLKEKHQLIYSDKGKASVIMKEFFKHLDALDQRNNIIFAVFGNGLLLWDLKQAYRVEQWIKSHGADVEQWFDVISFFDAQNSLANYVFNHPSYAYPKISTERAIINAKELGHPLLSETKRITSDCFMDVQSFFIVTGANMAGKSTFLRTISLSIVMSNIGLPVCATEMEYCPIKLITSIRNSDSLSEDTSYFFSELKRLKYIVDALQTDSYFIVLDEILKGTNSTDKAEGSQKFVEKLVKLNATGIIATHDLSLCEIEKEYNQIKNYYFDAEIINDELFFDYKLKQGVCQNMNASFLLRKMEIV